MKNKNKKNQNCLTNDDICRIIKEQLGEGSIPLVLISRIVKMYCQNVAKVLVKNSCFRMDEIGEFSFVYEPEHLQMQAGISVKIPERFVPKIYPCFELTEMMNKGFSEKKKVVSGIVQTLRDENVSSVWGDRNPITKELREFVFKEVEEEMLRLRHIEEVENAFAKEFPDILATTVKESLRNENNRRTYVSLEDMEKMIKEKTGKTIK